MISIYQDSIIFSFWENGQRRTLTKKIQPSEVIGLIWEPVELIGCVKLRRIFDIVKINIPAWSLIIQEDIKSIIDEMDVKDFNRPLVSDQHLEYIEICWETEQSDGRVYINPSMFGFKDNENYGLGYTPAGNLVDVEIRLNENLVIYDYDFDIHHGCAPVRDDTYLGKRYFTLLDIVKGIFGELTSLGPPGERDKKIRGMADSFPEFFKPKT